MKKISLFAATALLLGACSTSNKLAQQKDYNDDVYYSEAKAREELPVIVKSATANKEQNYRTDEQLYGDNYYNDYSYNDYRYSNRINRFYYETPWSYNRYNRYDPYFDYYRFDNWYNPGFSYNIGNPWSYNNYNSYNYYGNSYGYPYYGSQYWGPVSYNSYYPGYGYGGYSGGGYYPAPSVTDPNYRPRPVRGSENIGGSISGIQTIRRDGQGRIMTSPSRGETNEKTTSVSPSGKTSTTPTTSRARPERAAAAPQDNTPAATPSYEPRQSAPQPAPQPSSSGGGGNNSTSDESSRARPARVGN